MPNEILEVELDEGVEIIPDVPTVLRCIVCDLFNHEQNRYARRVVDTDALERIMDIDLMGTMHEPQFQSIAHDTLMYTQVVHHRYDESHIPAEDNPREVELCGAHNDICYHCENAVLTHGGLPYSVRDYYHGINTDSANYYAAFQQSQIAGHLDGNIDQPICRPCVNGDDFIQCDGCNTISRDAGDHQWINGGDSLVCNRCYGLTHYCSTCDTRRFDDDDNHYHSDDDYDSDYDDEDSHGSSRLVHSYSHKPDPIFHQTLLEAQNAEIVHDVSKSWSMPYVRMTHLGFELEVEDKANNYHAGAEVALSVNTDGEDIVYLKNDGSLNNGFEIVSHPMTLSWFKENFDTEIFRKLVRLGFRSWNTGTCGIHVHVARDAFIDISHQAKFVHLIMRHPEEWQALAGRSDSRWAMFDRELTKKLPAKLKSRTANERYTAVNLQNMHTLEIRIFKGSLKVERIMSALEFVDACVEYTRVLTVNEIMTKEGLSVSSFTAWVEQYNEKYPNLLHYLQINGIVDDTDSEEV